MSWSHCHRVAEVTYTEPLSQTNQDAFIAQEALHGQGAIAAFGVFDGHGAVGHLVSTPRVAIMPLTNIPGSHSRNQRRPMRAVL